MFSFMCVPVCAMDSTFRMDCVQGGVLSDFVIHPAGHASHRNKFLAEVFSSQAGLPHALTHVGLTE